MLSQSDERMLEEFQSEIARMVQTQGKIIKGQDKPTFSLMVASANLQALILVERTLLSIIAFNRGAFAGLSMVDVIRRICHPTEWEAFNRGEYNGGKTKSQRIEIAEFGGGSSSEGAEFERALQATDGLIEESIMLESLVVTYKAGTVLLCGYCGQPQTLVKDGFLPEHALDVRPGVRQTCPWSNRVVRTEEQPQEGKAYVAYIIHVTAGASFKSIADQLRILSNIWTPREMRGSSLELFTIGPVDEGQQHSFQEACLNAYHARLIPHKAETPAKAGEIALKAATALLEGKENVD